MGSQVSAKTNDKEQQLKKASKMAMVRALLPIVGLVVIFLLFNVLTDFCIRCDHRCDQRILLCIP